MTLLDDLRAADAAFESWSTQNERQRAEVVQLLANALPKLLAVVEAAREVCLRETASRSPRADVLDAALAALEETPEEREPAPLWGDAGPQVGQVITIAGTSMQTRWTGTHWEQVK